MKTWLLAVLVFPLAVAAQSSVAALSTPTDEDLASIGIGAIRRAVISDTPSTRWENAFLSGNGRHGAMVMGRTQSETIIFNHAGLFLPYTRPLPAPNQGAHLSEIRALMAAGKYQDAAELVMKLSDEEGYGGTRWTDPFVPACSLKIEAPEHGMVRDYVRGTDYPTGVVGTRWTDESGTYVRRLFVSRADDVIVLSLTSPSGAPLDLDLSFVQHDRSVMEKNEPAPTDAFNLVETSVVGSTLRFHSRFAKAWPGSPQGCEAAAQVVLSGGGTLTAQGDRLLVRGAREVLVLGRASIIRDYAKRDAEALAKALSSQTSNYEELLARHVALHGKIFNRARLDLGGSEAADHRLPARKLFEKSGLGRMLPALMEKQFDACRYLILSSSGPEFPPTLQGIWGGTWSPAWSGDYTHDGNLPVAVIGNLPGNMPELMEGFFSYHESLLPAYRENARRLFGTRGIVMAVRTGSHGFANHFGPKWCLSFWSAGAAWAAHYYYEYWLHTGDREFLFKHALPFMRETALFYEDFLAGMEGPDGKVVFSPSYSPENDAANTGSQACINATMDIAACRELLRNLVAICTQENIEPEAVARWQTLLAKLPAYRINAEGAVAEWSTPLLQDNYAHRHVSHLYELYDGLPQSIASDPALVAAFRVALQKRTDWRRQIGGGEMAFGQAQMGAVAASLGQADIAFENLDMLSNWFWFTDSMMTAHNPHSIFNTDIAGGIPQLVIRMLLDAQPGAMDLLPALPAQWQEGEIAGVLCRGQIEVKSLRWTPSEVTLTLCSAISQTVRVGLRHEPASQRDLALPAATEITLKIPRTARSSAH